MDSKKLLIILIAIIVIAVFLIVILPIALGGGNSSKGRSSGYVDREYKKQVEKVENGDITGKYDSENKNYSYYNLTQDGRNNVDKCIDTIMDYFNNDNYEGFYKLISGNYKSALFPEVSDVERYIKRLKNNKTGKFVASSFENLAGDLLINVAYEETQFSTTATFRLNNYEDFLNNNLENVEFYFTPVERIYAMQSSSTFYMVKITVNYCIKAKDTLSYALEIYNPSDEEVKIDFKDTKLVTLIAGRELTYGMVTSRYVTVPAKETVRYEIGFKEPDISPDYIDTTININGKEEKSQIHFYVYDED